MQGGPGCLTKQNRDSDRGLAIALPVKRPTVNILGTVSCVASVPAARPPVQPKRSYGQYRNRCTRPPAKVTHSLSPAVNLIVFPAHKAACSPCLPLPPCRRGNSTLTSQPGTQQPAVGFGLQGVSSDSASTKHRPAGNMAPGPRERWEGGM